MVETNSCCKPLLTFYFILLWAFGRKQQTLLIPNRISWGVEGEGGTLVSSLPPPGKEILSWDLRYSACREEFPLGCPWSKGKLWAQVFSQKSHLISQQAWMCWMPEYWIYTSMHKKTGWKKWFTQTPCPPKEDKQTWTSRLQTRSQFSASCPAWQIRRKTEKECSRPFQLPGHCSSVSCKLTSLKFLQYIASWGLLKSTTNWLLSP